MEFLYLMGGAALRLGLYFAICWIVGRFASRLTMGEKK